MTVHAEGENNNASKAVRNFPSLFRSSNNANTVKVIRLCRGHAKNIHENRELKLLGTTAMVSRITENGRKQVTLKARSGYGTKRQLWVTELHKKSLASSIAFENWV